MILSAAHFKDDIESAFEKAPATLRAAARWRVLNPLADVAHDMPHLIAQVDNIGGHNDPIYCRILGLLSHVAGGMTGNGQAILYDAARAEFIQPWGQALLPANEPVTLTAEGWHEWIKARFEANYKAQMEFDTDHTVADFTLAKAIADMHEIASSYVNLLFKRFVTMMDADGSSGLAHYLNNPENEWQKDFKGALRIAVLRELQKPHAEFLDRADPELVARLQKTGAPLLYYNLATQDSEPFARTAIFDFLTSPYARFISPTRLDDSGMAIIDKVAAGLHPAAAVAQTFDINPTTVQRLAEKTNVPRNFRSQLMQMNIPHVETSRNLVVGLAKTDVSLWPVNENEWYAFHRVLEALDVQAESLPVTPDVFLNTMASREKAKPYFRWHSIEQKLLSGLVRMSGKRHTQMTENGTRVGDMVEGPYWTIITDRQGELKNFDIRYSALQRLVEFPYMWMAKLKPEEARAYFAKLYDGNTPSTPPRPPTRVRRGHRRIINYDQ